MKNKKRKKIKNRKGKLKNGRLVEPTWLLLVAKSRCSPQLATSYGGLRDLVVSSPVSYRSAGQMINSICTDRHGSTSYTVVCKWFLR